MYFIPHAKSIESGPIDFIDFDSMPGAYHQVVILTDTETGSQFATRGGPANEGFLDIVKNGFGTIRAQVGSYDAGFKDSPSSVVTTQNVSTIPTDYAVSVSRAIGFASAINKSDIPYSPFGPNSNSYASTFVESLTGTRPAPTQFAPGWGESVSSSAQPPYSAPTSYYDGYPGPKK